MVAETRSENLQKAWRLLFQAEIECN